MPRTFDSTQILDNIRELSATGELLARGAAVSLVTNWDGTRLYCDRMGWGRLWRWIHSLAEWIGAEKDYPAKLQLAIKRTDAGYHSSFVHMGRDLHAFSRYVGERMRGEQDAVEAPGVRRRIAQWTSAIPPLVNPRSLDRIREAAVRVHPSFAHSFTRSPSEDTVLVIAGMYRSIIRLEGILGDRLPLRALFQLANGSEDYIDERPLRLFLDTLEEQERVVELRHLHTALGALIGHINAFEISAQTAPPHLGRLEWELLQRGCSVLCKEDPAQSKWLAQLIANAREQKNKPSLELRPVELAGEPSRHWKVYRASPGSFDLLIPVNQALAAAEYYWRKQADREGVCGLLEADVRGADPAGRMLLIERLTPIHLGVHVPEQLHRIKLVVAEMLNSKSTPVGLQTAQIGWARDKSLRSLFRLQQGPFDFIAVLDFLSVAFAKHPELAAELVRDTNLGEHPARAYFDRIIAAESEGEAIDLIQEAAERRLGDSQIYKRALALRDWAREQRIQGGCGKEEIRAKYMASGIPGCLPL